MTTRQDLNALMEHDSTCGPADKYNFCWHDELSMMARMYLCTDDPNEAPPAVVEVIDHLDRVELFATRWEYSLCPVHGCDYATCFDDEDPTCEAVRDMFPEHDT